jgi:hypothetical protein
LSRLHRGNTTHHLLILGGDLLNALSHGSEIEQCRSELL